MRSPWPIERLLDRAELALNALHPRNQLLLVLDEVRHLGTIPQYCDRKNLGHSAIGILDSTRGDPFAKTQRRRSRP